MVTSGASNGGTHRSASDDGAVLVDQRFEERDLVALRRTVAAHADRANLSARRVADLVLIVSELASNALRHGGGAGRLRLWTTGTAIHCQVSDEGPGVPQPHRTRPDRPEPTAPGGRGLWLVTEFSDGLTIGTGREGGAIITATVNLAPPDRT
jgi:anti-sigma regulatory factor (Ser/Thr protein kinase)